MFTGANWQETHEWNLHACQRTKSVPGAVADIHSWTESAHAHQDEYVKRDQVGDEDVSSPSRNHISVEKSAECAPECRTELQSLDPKEEGKYE